MKYSVGDRVKLLKAKRYSDGTKISTGRRGRVKKVYSLSQSYRIKFDQIAKSRRVLEKDLGSA